MERMPTNKREKEEREPASADHAHETHAHEVSPPVVHETPGAHGTETSHEEYSTVHADVNDHNHSDAHDHGHDKTGHVHDVHDEHVEPAHEEPKHGWRRAREKARAAPSLSHAVKEGASDGRKLGYITGRRTGLGVGLLLLSPFIVLGGATYGMWWLSGKAYAPIEKKFGKSKGDHQEKTGHHEKKDHDHGHNKGHNHGHDHKGGHGKKDH